MSRKQIMVFTTGRADYGLLHPLVKLLSEDVDLQTFLVVTGSHLSSYHGNTIQFIENDGLSISDTIDMNVEGDTEDVICSSIAKGIPEISKLLKKRAPHLIIVLGDRYELLSICCTALIHKIPIAHISGGEITLGAIDDSIRNCITKLSTFHFPSIKSYSKRIIQMGEPPDRVFTVGALGLDNIRLMTDMTKKELSDYTKIDFNNKIALLTYHPVTLDPYDNAEKQIQEVLDAIIQTDLMAIITMPNSDVSCKIIFKNIENYLKQYPERFKLIKNLGQTAYLNTMKYCSIMIGNSSSGIVESASFKLPVVNIGDRQQGRFKPANIIDCQCSKIAILKAIKKALSMEFYNSLSDITNPYGDGYTASRILRILKEIDLSDKGKLLKKGFYDLNI